MLTLKGPPQLNGYHLITVLWIERAIDGTAASSHLRGTLARLRAVDMGPENVIADTLSSDGAEPALLKLRRIAGLFARGMAKARPNAVLISRFHPLLLPVLWWWKARGGRSVLLVQGSLDDIGASGNSHIARLRIVRAISILTLRYADRLVVGAPTIHKHIQSFVPNKMVASIPNGVFIDDFATMAACATPHPGPFAVYVGNFASWQGIEHMVGATKSREWPAGLPLVVIGDGFDRKVVEEAQSERLIWLGRLPSAEARIWLANAVCAISLKRSDTPTGQHGYWPFKLIESAAVGTPIVSSDAPGMPEAAQQLGHAIVVKAQDAEQAAIAVAAIHGDPALRAQLSRKGLENVRAFDWLAEAGSLAEIIREL